MKTFRAYMVVGGMPQAVDSFVKGETFNQIDFIKTTICALYEADARTFGADGRLASRMYKSIPQQLFNNIKDNEKGKQI